MKKELTVKKSIIILFLTTVVILILVALLNIAVDPFYHYHRELGSNQPHMFNAYYQTSGAATNFEYDAAIVGTSLSENHHISWFKEYGLNGEKFTYPSATFKDYGMILDHIFKSGNDVKCIIMDISDFQLATCRAGDVYTTDTVFLNDDDLFDDYNYIWNMDVTKLSLLNIANLVAGKENDHDFDYTWENPEFFTYVNCMRDTVYEREMILAAKAEGSYTYFDMNSECDYKVNLEEIIPYIEANPDTTFYIYIPPFSILYWELQMMEGRIDWILNVYEDTVDILDKYDNVEVISFIDETEIITDLDLYRDSGHYGPSVNRFIFESVFDGSHRVDKDEFRKQADAIVEYVNDYDFDTVWQKWYVE